MGCNNQENRL